MRNNKIINNNKEKNNKILGMINFIFLFTILVGVFVSLVSINIINTKMFSPYGDGREKYALIKEELGEDFEKFIKDDAGIKIYEENGKINIIRIGDNEYKINW